MLKEFSGGNPKNSSHSLQIKETFPTTMGGELGSIFIPEKMLDETAVYCPDFFYILNLAIRLICRYSERYDSDSDVTSMVEWQPFSSSLWTLSAFRDSFRPLVRSEKGVRTDC